MRYAAWAFTVVGCVGVGGYLAVNDHPWFALLAMLIAGCMEVHSSKD